VLGVEIMRVSRLLRRRFDRRARDLGLSRAQWQTIACVRRIPGARQRKIAELLEIGEVAVGRSIDRLVEAGWLERRADPNDRRVCRIYLTQAIEPVLDDLAHMSDEEDAVVFQGFSEAERASLGDMLDRMARNIEDDIGETGHADAP
jgi:DNA-binding MarR family transcriptional regulator